MCITLNIHEARALAISSQGYDSGGTAPDDKEATLAVLERTGYIQIDTISVVKRAHHHSFWNRHRHYKERYLDELMSRDRRIFEYWGHAASYLPMEDYRFYLRHIQQLIKPDSQWYTLRLKQSKNHIEPVLKTIRKEGAKSARDFESRATPGGGWWDWKPAKMALEILFWRGELMISHRQGFQKYYDLPERILPEKLNTHPPSQEERLRFLAIRALRAHGLVTAEDVSRYLFGGPQKELKNTLESLVAEGLARHGRILDQGRSQPCFIDNAALDRLPGSGREKGDILFLSPFDNLVINRRRVLRLFAFDYTIECYLPASKRRYGYFSMPVLSGTELIGRMDAKADRSKSCLIVRHLAFEAGFEGNDAFWSAFETRLKDFARFNDCDTVVIERVSPEKHRKQSLRGYAKTGF